MRPPQYAGEIRPRTCSTFPISGGFNEAPAIRGGNRISASRTVALKCCFNEAPAIRGGNPKGDVIRKEGEILLQ